MQTLSAERVSTIAPYYQRPLAIALTFGTFFALVVPLVWLRVSPNDSALLPYLVLAEAVGLGTSHFFLTLAIYLQPSQIKYANSSWARRLTYFGLPALILLLFAGIEAWPLRENAPQLAAPFYLAIRFADFFHVGRQSVGVLQIWKMPLRASLPTWTTHAENALFIGIALLQWETFAVGGTFPSERITAWLPALLLVGLFLAICVQYLAPLSMAQTRRSAALALGYLVTQTLCAAAAAYATWLYLTVLAVHYLEYHVLMAPRCFSEQSGPRTGALGLLRRGAVFYGLMAVVLVLFEARSFVVTESLSLRYAVHIFDGIFMLHYVLDGFLWKFRNPYYRAQLYPLYFEPRLRPNAALPTKRAFQVLGAALAGLALALALPPTREGVLGLAKGFQTRVIDPLHAEEYKRWGMREAESGELGAAQQHFARAAALAPEDVQLKQWLSTVEQTLRGTQERSAQR
jgi:hypothetical protein